MQEYNKQQQQIIQRVVKLPLDADDPWRREGHVRRYRLLIPREYLELEHAFNKHYHFGVRDQCHPERFGRPGDSEGAPHEHHERQWDREDGR